MATNIFKIPLFSVFMSPEVKNEIIKVLYSGYIGEGPVVKSFEKQLANYLKNQWVLTLYSGTAALNLALRLAGVEGKAVITTALTCSATNWPILENKASIVWADIDPETANISSASILERLETTTDVAAIMVVHWGGYPCDLLEINDMARAYGIPVIEDAAHALGSVYQGMPIGNHSDFVCFSLQAIKNVTSIDGGILATAKYSNYYRGKLLRWYGIDREAKPGQDLRCENDVPEYGHKYHMNDVCATVGMCNFKYLDAILKRNRSNANYYDSNLKDVSGVELLNYKPDRKSSYWLYTMKVEKRDDFMRYMAEKGVMTSKVHARNDNHTCVKNFWRELPKLDLFVKNMICIPVGYHVSEEDRFYIVDCIKKGW